LIHARLRQFAATTLVAASIATLSAAPVTVTFTADAPGSWADGIANDGDGGSTNIPGRVLEIYMISDTAGTRAASAPLNYQYALDDFRAIASYNAPGDGRLKGMAIRSNDGSEFQLNGFYYANWGESSPHAMSVVGYRNGSQVASTSFSTALDIYYQAATVSLDSTFDNVDEVRVFSTTGTSWHGLNDLVVDDPVAPPTVTDANISISGGSGIAGAYRIGDTVTAAWNNTASGDNNAGITGVTVNFAQFGGGSAVAASNAGGTWTATYTVVAGAIDTGNRNVSVTASNGGASTTTSDTTNATVDNIRPSVSSITVSGSPAASDTSMAFAVSFSESVANVSTGDFTLVATGSASGSIASVSASTGASMNVNITSISGSGTLKVNLNAGTDIVDDAGNAANAYSAGSTHTVSVPTAPDAPTIGAAVAGDGQVSVSFTAPVNNGGTAITGYTVTSSPGGITAGGNGFTTSPITVTGLTNGTAYTFTVTATNAVGTSTASGASNSATPKGDQTITFANPGAQTFGTTPTLTATATSALLVTFSSSTTGVCTISSGGMLTFVTAGSCTIDADQAGNGVWNAAPSVSRTFTVNAIVPGAPTVGTATAGNTDASLTFTAPASTGGAAITGYTATANPGGATGTAAGSPITVTGLTNGVSYTFTVTATNSAGTGAASAASNSVTPRSPQTITFANPGAQNFGTTPTFTATSDASLTVTFTSSTPGVCTITSQGAATFVTAGTCTINADQAGNASVLPAMQVSRTFTVNPVPPAAPTSVVATAGSAQASVAFAAPANTGGSAIVGYTVTTSPPDVAPVNGASSPIVVNGLTNGQAYTFTVTADNVAGTGPASQASNSVTPRATQTITFVNPGAQTFGTTPTFMATSDASLTVTFTSSTPGVCTITSQGTATFVTAGTCTINADQAGNGSYLPAAQVSRSFVVNAVVPGAPAMGAATAGDAQASVTFGPPASNGGAAITGYTVTASPGGTSGTGSGSPIVVTGLTNGTAYTFTVRATNSVGTGSPSTASNSVTPTPGVPTVSMSVAPASVSEAGGTPLVFTVARTPPMDAALTVMLSAGGTATSGLDFTGAVTSVTIPAHAASAAMVVTPVADSVDETDETVTMTIVSGSSYLVGASASATGTITNDIPVLAGPTHFRITAMAGNVVSLAWMLPTGDVTYTGILLEGGIAPGESAGIGQLLTLAPAATVTLPTGSYYLRLRLMTSDGLSAPSNEIRAHVNVPVLPSAPQFLLGSAVGSTLRLAWTPTFAGGAPTGAVVDVSGAAATSEATGVDGTFSFSGVPAGTYTFAVRQTNAVGASAASTPVTLTFPGACSAVPQPPQHVIAWSVAGRVLLQWDPPSSGPAPTAYALAVSGAFTGTLPVTGRAIDSPAPAGTYQLAVAATNACGTSTFSPLQTVEVKSLTPPPAPRATGDAYETPYGAVLSVAAPGLLVNDTSATGAMVATLVAAPANGSVAVTGAGGFTYTPRAGFSGVDTFTYRVSTLAGGFSAPAYVSIAVGAAPGPRPPLAAADAYSTTVDTALVVPAASGVLANDDALGATGLTALVQAAPAHGALALAANGSFTYTPAAGFAGADAFTYRPSTGAGGLGDPVRVAITVAGVGRPQPLTNFRVMRLTGNRVVLAWSMPASGPAPTGVLIEGGTSPGSVVGVLNPLPAASAAAVTLPSGSYYLRARATTPAGLSDPSNELLLHVGVPLAPAAPTALLGVVDGTAVQLAWTPTFTGGTPTGARVDVTGTLSASLAVSGDTFVHPNAPPGTYTFTVRQLNAAGASVASAPVTLTVPGTCSGAPLPPVGPVTAWIDGQLIAQWYAPRSGAAPTGYRVVVSGALNGSYATTQRFLASPVGPGTYTIAVASTNACGSSATTPPHTVVAR
jgi:hypothetical protein